MATSDRLDELATEARAERAAYERSSTAELVALMNAEDAAVPAAVAAVGDAIAAAIDAIVQRLSAGGRLVYVGAGSSGMIAALDADECEGTFSTAPGQVVAGDAGSARASARRPRTIARPVRGPSRIWRSQRPTRSSASAPAVGRLTPLPR